MASTRERGTVLSWELSQGHGRIESNRGDTLWVHFSQIVHEGFRALSPGQPVEFTRVEAPGPPSQRLQAHQVIILKSD
jgi:cold shock CspA family protein